MQASLRAAPAAARRAAKPAWGAGRTWRSSWSRHASSCCSVCLLWASAVVSTSSVADVLHGSREGMWMRWHGVESSRRSERAAPRSGLAPTDAAVAQAAASCLRRHQAAAQAAARAGEQGERRARGLSAHRGSAGCVLRTRASAPWRASESCKTPMNWLQWWQGQRGSKRSLVRRAFARRQARALAALPRWRPARWPAAAAGCLPAAASHLLNSGLEAMAFCTSSLPTRARTSRPRGADTAAAGRRRAAAGLRAAVGATGCAWERRRAPSQRGPGQSREW